MYNFDGAIWFGIVLILAVGIGIGWFIFSITGMTP